MSRPGALSRFLDAARETLSARVESGTPAGAAAARIFGALAARVGTVGPGDGRARPLLAPPPACRHLPDALERARAAPEVSALAQAFGALAPELRWRRRAGSQAHGRTFHDGHANADIVGPAGLERRDDVWVGASLVAPGVRYVDHRHPPEEVYIMMSDGEWFREDRGWRRPGGGGAVYTPPDAVHAMRAGAAPLLAIWLLRVDGGREDRDDDAGR